jgi:predicted MFS family arabinose efflux permease
MIAEVTIHLGQEWRDLAYCLFGMACGALIGGIFIDAWHTKQAKKK